MNNWPKVFLRRCIKYKRLIRKHNVKHSGDLVVLRNTMSVSSSLKMRNLVTGLPRRYTKITVLWAL
jgi:hypothetical protein